MVKLATASAGLVLPQCRVTTSGLPSSTSAGVVSTTSTWMNQRHNLEMQKQQQQQQRDKPILAYKSTPGKDASVSMLGVGGSMVVGEGG